MTDYTNVSKYLSMILRHKPEAIGITLDAHGWADVDELTQGIAKTYTFNKDILETIVRTDAKQRYAFIYPRTQQPPEPSVPGTGTRSSTGSTALPCTETVTPSISPPTAYGLPMPCQCNT